MLREGKAIVLFCTFSKILESQLREQLVRPWPLIG